MDEKIIKQKLLDNFLKYVNIPSQSNENNENVPSSEGQLVLAKKLYEELNSLGIEDVSLNTYGVVQAYIPSNIDNNEKFPSIGWVCHLDTVDVGLSEVVNPRIVKNYNGGDIILNREKDIKISPLEDKNLLSYIGDDIVVTDGNSVLGADNKAAIANVMTAVSYIVENPNLKHGDIYLFFVPDEEIGLRGVRKIDYSKFDVDFAYTIDCCKLGELVYETFNAASGKLKIKGVSAHPMNSKNNLVNPIMIAHEFISMLDRSKMPENTEGREGYIWVTDIHSNVLDLSLDFNIRDHDRENFEKSKRYLVYITQYLCKKYKKAKIEIEIEDVYRNIYDCIDDDNALAIDKLKEAYALLGIEPEIIPMRGGTDGSYLSTRNILTPNYFTGALNFHSNKEYLPMNSFYKSFLVTLELMIIKNWYNEYNSYNGMIYK